MKSKWSITTRLTLLFAIVSSGVLLAFSGIVISAIEKHFVEQDTDALHGKMVLVESAVARVRAPQELQALGQLLHDAFVGHDDLVMLALAPDGTTLHASAGIDFPLDQIRRIASAGRVDTFDWQAGKQAYRGLVKTIRSSIPPAAGSSSIVVAIAIDIDHHATFMARFGKTLSALAAAAALTCGLLGWLIAHRSLAPLRQMKEQASAVTANRLDTRLPEASIPVELAGLAETLNQMLERLEDAFKRLSDFSSDLAHELRTPITNLTTQTQVALSIPRDAQSYRETLGSNAEEFEHLSRMISDMLFLAKADHGLMLPSSTSIGIEQEVVELFDFYDALAEERQVTLSVDGDGQITGDRLMFRRAISNLLSNALRHTPMKGRISVHIQSAGSQTSVTVENTGQAIAAEDLPYLFDRFYRADKARTHTSSEGTGLGLAITKAIVTAHRGRVEVTSDSSGTRFTLIFPR
ncbi:MAG: heavy metal sensor histidine kinase [Rhodocyclales bacterium]|nr:heavy metal sensor histidine kinase [Rhodocyclales bacterium]